jgi:hypothetical protein
MKPLNTIIRSSFNGLTIRVLASEGKEYLVYLVDVKSGADKADSPMPGALSLSVELPGGSYTGSWIDTRTGDRTGMDIKGHPGGIITLATPPFTEDIALLIRSKN